MPVYGTEGETARKNFFVVTAYKLGPGANGPTPDLPTTGPCREWDGRPCVIKPHHLRDRKTGPCFPLSVVRCETHGRGFTLYPHGHVPYGRRAIAPLAPDGSPVRQTPDRSDSSRSSEFSNTYFDAALDAAAGRAWPREPEGGGQDRWWSVQGRHLNRSTLWLGVDPASTPRHTETIATALAVETLVLKDLQRDISRHPGYRARGEAVCSVLGALLKKPVGIGDRLAQAGHVAALWGPPFRWDLPPGVLRSVAFRPRSGAHRPRGP